MTIFNAGTYTTSSKDGKLIIKNGSVLIISYQIIITDTGRLTITSGDKITITSTNLTINTYLKATNNMNYNIENKEYNITEGTILYQDDSSWSLDKLNLRKGWYGSGTMILLGYEHVNTGPFTKEFLILDKVSVDSNFSEKLEVKKLNIMHGVTITFQPRSYLQLNSNTDNVTRIKSTFENEKIIEIKKEISDLLKIKEKKEQILSKMEEEEYIIYNYDNKTDISNISHESCISFNKDFVFKNNSNKGPLSKCSGSLFGSITQNTSQITNGIHNNIPTITNGNGTGGILTLIANSSSIITDVFVIKPGNNYMSGDTLTVEKKHIDGSDKDLIFTLKDYNIDVVDKVSYNIRDIPLNKWTTITGEENGCFPDNSTVKKKDGTIIKIQDLKIGDNILAGYKGKTAYYSIVYGFRKRVKTSVIRYQQIKTDSGHIINVSNTHYLISKNGRYISGADATKGDILYVLNEDGHFIKSKIVSNTSHHLQGAHCPLTFTGTIVVNNILASCHGTGTAPWVAEISYMPRKILYMVSPENAKIKNNELIYDNFVANSIGDKISNMFTPMKF